MGKRPPHVRHGTHHYVSHNAAKSAYGQDCEQALSEGTIAVGPPATKPGEWLAAKDGRYFICRPSAPASRS